jgi:hypothetical protein
LLIDPLRLNKNITVKDNSEGKIEVSGISECPVTGVDDLLKYDKNFKLVFFLV